MDENLYKKTIEDSVRARYTPDSVLQEFGRLTVHRRETLELHMPYGEETKSLLCVKNGDPEGLRAFYANLAKDGEQGGPMGHNALERARCAFTVAITLFTRFAVEGSLDQEEAYNLSDAYLQIMWGMEEPGAIMSMVSTSGMDLANRVRETKKARSPVIKKCLDYISNHLHYKITVAELAKECGLTPNYLSTHFREQVGSGLLEFIISEKLEGARWLLLLTGCTVAEAAEQFAFPSHSAFSVQFKKKYDLSPSEYRAQSRSPAWDSLK